MTRTILVAAALAALLPAAPAAGQPAPREGWVVLDTPHDFTTLNGRLDEAVKTAGMGLVTQASASAGAKAQGFDIPGNRVVGVFRNDFARRMLEASLSAGIEAPIRFYVTEGADGTATLSYRTPSALFEPYADEGGQALANLAAELDAVFRSIADDAAGS